MVSSDTKFSRFEPEGNRQRYILGSPVSCCSTKEGTQIITSMAQSKSRAYVCVANVHMLMESYWSSRFRDVLLNARVVTPDGMPLVWILRLLGQIKQERVSGMELFNSICNAAQSRELRIGLIGSTPEILKGVQDRLQREYPQLILSIVKPLPFRETTIDEDKELIESIKDSKSDILFISLGCPKQEVFMARHHESLDVVMIGVGGVFPVYAGLLKQTPKWMQPLGLEWLFRLIQEPGRLWEALC